MRYTTTRPAERLRRSVVSRYQGNPESLSRHTRVANEQRPKSRSSSLPGVLVASHPPLYQLQSHR